MTDNFSVDEKKKAVKTGIDRVTSHLVRHRIVWKFTQVYRIASNCKEL